jgi:hypothetical protein
MLALTSVALKVADALSRPTETSGASPRRRA